MAMIGKFFVAAAYAIIYIYSSEIFPTSIRNTCMGCCSMMARIGSMVFKTKKILILAINQTASILLILLF